MTEELKQLFDLLKIQFAKHQDPERSAYVYIATLANNYIPREQIMFHINAALKEVEHA